MKRRLRSAAGLAITLTIGLIVASAVRPGDRALAVDAYVLALGGLALLLLVHATRTAFPDPPPSGRRRRGPNDDERSPLAELARTEREVALATGTAFDVHYRLRPLLRDVVAHRLATRRGIDLDREPAAAAAALGDQTWEIVRPDRPRPKYHFAAGLSLTEIRTIVATIERI